MKRIMFLDGLRYLKAVKCYYIITADYLPDNIAHKWSDGVLHKPLREDFCWIDGFCESHPTPIH